MTPLERAARALAMLENPEEDDEWYDENLHHYMPTVEAARSALIISDPLSPILERVRCTVGEWNAMINAILEEG